MENDPMENRNKLMSKSFIKNADQNDLIWACERFLPQGWTVLNDENNTNDEIEPKKKKKKKGEKEKTAIMFAPWLCAHSYLNMSHIQIMNILANGTNFKKSHISPYLTKRSANEGNSLTRSTTFGKSIRQPIWIHLNIHGIRPNDSPGDTMQSKLKKGHWNNLNKTEQNEIKDSWELSKDKECWEVPENGWCLSQPKGAFNISQQEQDQPSRRTSKRASFGSPKLRESQADEDDEDDGIELTSLKTRKYVANKVIDDENNQLHQCARCKKWCSEDRGKTKWGVFACKDCSVTEGLGSYFKQFNASYSSELADSTKRLGELQLKAALDAEKKISQQALDALKVKTSADIESLKAVVESLTADAESLTVELKASVMRCDELLKSPAKSFVDRAISMKQTEIRDCGVARRQFLYTLYEELIQADIKVDLKQKIRKELLDVLKCQHYDDEGNSCVVDTAHLLHHVTMPKVKQILQEDSSKRKSKNVTPGVTPKSNDKCLDGVGGFDMGDIINDGMAILNDERGSALKTILEALTLSPNGKKELEDLRVCIDSNFENRTGIDYLKETKISNEEIQSKYDHLNGRIESIWVYLTGALSHIRDHNQEVHSPMVVALSTVMSESLSQGEQEIFSKLGLLVSSSTTEALKNDAAKKYEANFASVFKEQMRLHVNDDDPVRAHMYVICFWIDNYVAKAGMAKHHCRVGDASLSCTTLQSLFRGLPYSDLLISVAERKDPISVPFSTKGKEVLESFWEDHLPLITCSPPDQCKANILLPVLHGKKCWLPPSVTVEFPRCALMAQLRDYFVCPAVPGKSSLYAHYWEYCIKRLQKLSKDDNGGGVDIISQGYVILCHDIEFWFHFFKSLEEPQDDIDLKNVILMFNELHIQKHLMDVVIQDNFHVLHLFSDTFINKFKFAPNKWKKIFSAVLKEVNEDAAIPVAVSTPELGESGGGGGGEKEDEEDEDEEDTSDTLGEDIKGDVEEPGDPSPLHWVNCFYCSCWWKNYKQKACIGVAIPDIASDHFNYKCDECIASGVIEPIIVQVEEGESGVVKEFTSRSHCTSHRMPFLQDQYVLRGWGTKAELLSLKLKKPELVLIFIEKLNLPQRKKQAQKPAIENVKINTTRALSSFLMLLKVWLGDRRDGGEGSARKFVIDQIKETFPELIGFDDDVIVGKICDQSSYFYGLWKLLDIEIVVCILPFIQWTEGDFLPFLNLFPIMVQMVSYSGKSTAIKAFMLKMFVLQWYATKHPDILKTMGQNCTILVETMIEYHNSRMAYMVPSKVPSLNIDHYKKASCLRAAFDQLKRSITNEPTKKKQSERMRQLNMVNSKASVATVVEFKSLVTDKFVAILKALKNGTLPESDYANSCWPVVERLKIGQDKLNKTLTDMVGFYAEYKVLAADPAHPLAKYLRSAKVTVKLMKEELRRGGVTPPPNNNKPLHAQWLFEHIRDNPLLGKPLNYEGEFPASDCSFVPPQVQVQVQAADVMDVTC
eukprot:CAMPEP_0114401742 /NCGR_PEP_ID=MMETSP0102-20121206/17461_1 /TAXON_ID=38822 ORGANISM="Pteridomonas danica, Strain PT" /NCGR_SAMPLE_ID=MMETSP0102 /ASSEMBLY_ACC=CAM_ASM_000212 /LENGTH=1480 /DNA_ID=CAMNT_0001564943 /DNA_START=66 /DNA_END=4505 /DNA_ORIENTATION=+